MKTDNIQFQCNMKRNSILIGHIFMVMVQMNSHRRSLQTEGATIVHGSSFQAASIGFQYAMWAQCSAPSMLLGWLGYQRAKSLGDPSLHIQEPCLCTSLNPIQWAAFVGSRFSISAVMKFISLELWIETRFAPKDRQ